MARFEISNVIHKPDVRGSISLFGRALITIGLILLLFVAYQLWGTNLIENHAQKGLKNEFKQKQAKVKKAGVNTTGTTSPDGQTGDPNSNSPVVSDGEPTSEELSQEIIRGKPIAIIKIDKIGLEHAVVSGTDKVSLQKGPGHYPATPLPGQLGNSAIAGHRTTYGAPFSRLNELTIGDKIVLETLRGNFTYIVNKPNQVVSPNDVSVIEPTPDPTDPTGQKLLPTLTLTTCHPKYSAAQRLIIKAELSDSDKDRATVAVQLKDKDGKIPTVIDLGNDDTQDTAGIGHSNILATIALASMKLPLLWWLLLVVTVGCIWWYLFRKFHNWKMWIAGAIPFGFVLLLYFFQLEHALPSNI